MPFIEDNRNYVILHTMKIFKADDDAIFIAQIPKGKIVLEEEMFDKLFRI